VILQFAHTGGGAVDLNAIGISGLKIAIFLVGIGSLAYVVHKINFWFPKRLKWFFVKAKTTEANGLLSNQLSIMDRLLPLRR
jgi:hypothetical protein